MKISRNDPCKCGSGKKYKHCCLNDSDNIFSSGVPPGFKMNESLPEEIKQYYSKKTEEKYEENYYTVMAEDLYQDLNQLTLEYAQIYTNRPNPLGHHDTKNNIYTFKGMPIPPPKIKTTKSNMHYMRKFTMLENLIGFISFLRWKFLNDSGEVDISIMQKINDIWANPLNSMNKSSFINAISESLRFMAINYIDEYFEDFKLPNTDIIREFKLAFNRKSELLMANEIPRVNYDENENWNNALTRSIILISRCLGNHFIEHQFSGSFDDGRGFDFIDINSLTVETSVKIINKSIKKLNLKKKNYFILNLEKSLTDFEKFRYKWDNYIRYWKKVN